MNPDYETTRPVYTGGGQNASDPLHDLLLPHLDGVKPSNGSWMARCPAHQDGSASLSIGEGKDHPVVLHCHAGCASEDILGALSLTWADLLDPNAQSHKASGNGWMPCGHTRVAEYEYRNPRGELVFAVARCALKGNGCQGFRQWRPDPDSKSGRRWSLKLPDGSKIGEGLPYRLPELLTSSPDDVVYIVEGEKDADLLWAIGFPATCNAGGAGKWTTGHAQWLNSRDVIVVADRDEPGEKHAVAVVNTLWPVARSVEIAQAHDGKDVADHFAAGGNIGSLVRVYAAKLTTNGAP